MRPHSLLSGTTRPFSSANPHFTRSKNCQLCRCSGIQQRDVTPDAPTSRRQTLSIGLATMLLPTAVPAAAQAGFKKELKKRKVPLEDYTVSDLDGLRFFDNEAGRGRVIAPGDRVVVHFDCRFKGIDAVSSRYARTLGGNRTIAEPFEFVAGERIIVTAKKANDSAGGLFAGGSGPKPPPALSTAVVGMRPGGRRTVYVDKPELGYPAGNQEIPPGGSFELAIEVLSAGAGAATS